MRSHSLPRALSALLLLVLLCPGMAYGACRHGDRSGAIRAATPEKPEHSGHRGEALRGHPADGPDVDLRIRIEPRRVRVTLTVNLAFVDETFGYPRENESEVHEVEEAGLNEAFFAFVREQLSVRVDGIIVPPRIHSSEMVNADPSMPGLFPNFGRRAIARTVLSLDHPLLEAPERVAVTWRSYPPDWALASFAGKPPLEIIAQLTAGGVTSDRLFTQVEPTQHWISDGTSLEPVLLSVPTLSGGDPGFRIPIISLVLSLGAILALGLAAVSPSLRGATLVGTLFLVVGAFSLRGYGRELAFGEAAPRALDQQLAREIFEPLHKNLYRAFDYGEESDVYDALAQSVGGDLLESIYDQVYRSLVMEEEGGAVGRIAELTPGALEILSIGEVGGQPGFRLRTDWTVLGEVAHFGHAHGRLTHYDSEYSVARTSDGWRIVAEELHEQRREELPERPLQPLTPEEEAGSALPEGEERDG